MSENIYHYSAIEIFYKLGYKKGFFPVKEFALSNLITELTQERIDLVWIDLRTGQVEYAFEFEVTKNGWGRSKRKFWKIDEGIKKYIFEVKKVLNFEKLNALYVKDINAEDFLKDLENYGIRILINNKTLDESKFETVEVQGEKNEN